ncbi:MAG: PASTA domain-containing protein [Bacteroidales bacterium]
MNDFVRFLLSKIFWKNVARAAGIFLGLLLVIFIWLRIYTRHNESIAVPDFTGHTLAECEQMAALRKIRVTVTDSVYMNNMPRGTMVSQNPPAGFRVKRNRSVFLVMNALTPEKVKMPNVVGFSLRQARAILESQGLATGRLIYIPDIAQNEVLRQQFAGREIPENTLIEKGSRIDLVLGSGLSNRNTYVPNLRGLSVQEAEQKLFDTFLNLGAVIYDNTILTLQDTLNAKVYRQNPSEGLVSLGAPVDVWVTIAPSLLSEGDSLAVPEQ